MYQAGSFINAKAAVYCKTHCVFYFVCYNSIIKRDVKDMYEYFNFDFKSASFEWDEQKDIANFQKHGIHFKTAAKVFMDPYKLIREDEEHLSEQRFDILGKVGKILFVVCAFRRNNTVRLISARIATKPERERYEHGENEMG